jgi:hypothetical protein
LFLFTAFNFIFTSFLLGRFSFLIQLFKNSADKGCAAAALPTQGPQGRGCAGHIRRRGIKKIRPPFCQPYLAFAPVVLLTVL